MHLQGVQGGGQAVTRQNFSPASRAVPLYWEAASPITVRDKEFIPVRSRLPVMAAKCNSKEENAESIELQKRQSCRGVPSVSLLPAAENAPVYFLPLRRLTSPPTGRLSIVYPLP